MREYLKFYIDGQWVDPIEPKTLDVDNPTTEQVSGKIAIGVGGRRRQGGQGGPQGLRDVVADAPARSASTLLEAILAEYQKRSGDLADAVTEEMGAPPSLAAGPQVDLGLGHLATAIDALKNFEFEEQRGATLIVKEPIGVCGLITPWNWPINQIACKVVPGAGHRLHDGAQAVRGRAVLGPDLHRDHRRGRRARRASTTWSYGDGPSVGAAMSSHPDIDMVSFTGSTRAGIDVAKNAAPTVKRVHPGTRRQEPEHRARRRRLRQERRPRASSAMMMNTRPEL